MGTGIGQLALEARRRVSERGFVVGLDVSVDALKICRVEATQQEREESGLGYLALAVGNGVALPFRDETFDHVLTRSVLIYIPDKQQAAHEFRRVLHPGGQVSMYEPINKASLGTWPFGTVDSSELQPEHDLVIDWLSKNDRFREEMCGFDERDLLAYFEEAGFSSITLNYTHTSSSNELRISVCIFNLGGAPQPRRAQCEGSCGSSPWDVRRRVHGSPALIPHQAKAIDGWRIRDT